MRVVNPNLSHLCHSYKKKRGALLEGSSRSGKTWSSVDFIIYLCSRNKGLTINIIKETYRSFKTTLYDDFNRRLPMYGILSPFQNRQEVAAFKLFENKINFLGADSESVAHGVSCDYFYINEMLDVSRGIFDQAEMRCRKFWWGDYNPRVTDHWVYDNVAGREDVAFLKTTFRDNPFVSQQERAKILSYEPTEKNKINGTADEYMWNVYGLGLRSAPEGLIFQYVNWLSFFPEEIETTCFGLDFGYSNSPTALVRVGFRGTDIFACCEHYGATPSANELIPILRSVCGDKIIWADSSDPGLIAECRRAGINVFATLPYPGSVRHGISLLKQHKLFFVDNVCVKKEQANYKWKQVHGIKLDEPAKGNDHFFDALRYAVMASRRT